jgi:2-iminoacetate synthase
MIIDETKIFELLDTPTSKERAWEILQKALELKGLEIDEVASLLNISDPELLQELFDTAKKVKDEIYGKRLVLFTPLYISNFCSNDCLYCGFQSK